MLNKLTSRKFWLAVAAFLASIGGSITGIVTDQEWVTVFGMICTMLSAAIYAASEAYVDGASAKSNTTSTTTTTNVNANTSNNETVKKVLESTAPVVAVTETKTDEIKVGGTQ